MSRPEFAFEELKGENVEKCAKVLIKALGDRLSPELRKVEAVGRMIYGPRVITIVAKRGDNVVGIVSGSAIIPPSIVFLHAFDEESSRMGLEGMLTDEFTRAIRKKLPKAPYVTTTITTDSTGAVSFYSAKGFVISGFVKEGMGDKDVVVLRKSVR